MVLSHARLPALAAGLLLLLAAQAAAYAWTDCGAIALSAPGLTVSEGQTAGQSLLVFNHAGADFWLDFAEVGARQDAVLLEVTGFDRVAPAGGYAVVRLSATALAYPEGGKAWGVLRVRGHFPGAPSCGVAELGAAAFPVYVSPAPRAFTVALPAPSPSPAFPYPAPPPPGFARPLSPVSAPSPCRPQTAYPGCAPQGPGYALSVPVQPPPSPPPPSENGVALSLRASAHREEDRVRVEVEVENRGPRAVQGIASVSLPEGWLADGARALTVAPASVHALSFTLRPMESASSGEAVVHFSFNGGTLQTAFPVEPVPAPAPPPAPSQPAAPEPQPSAPASQEPAPAPAQAPSQPAPAPLPPPLPAGLLGLGADAVVVGLLVLAALAVVFFAD